VKKRGLFVLLLLAVLAAACDEPARQAGGREILVIGAAGAEGQPLTKSALNGVDLAVAEYNANPDSSYQVRRAVFNTAATPEGANAAAQTLIATERLIAVVGPHLPDEVLTVGGPLSERNIPFLIPAVADIRLAQQGWRSYRRLVANDFAEGEALGTEAVTRGDRGKAAIFHDGGSSHASVADGARSALEKQQVPITRYEAAGGKSPDFSSLAPGILSDPPSAIIYSGPAGRAGAFLAALRKAGFKGIFLASHDARVPEFREAAKEAAEGAISTCVCADPSDAELEAFVGQYRDKFRSTPAPFAAEAYEGTLMVLEAIQEVEPRPRAISDFFRVANSFLGDTKLYRYADNGELEAPPVWLFRLRGDRWELIGRSGRATEDSGSVR
jgi:ABC-type branched-subunit amino acid transport system substrate-binding protein